MPPMTFAAKRKMQNKIVAFGRANLSGQDQVTFREENTWKGFVSKGRLVGSVFLQEGVTPGASMPAQLIPNRRRNDPFV